MLAVNDDRTINEAMYNAASEKENNCKMFDYLISKGANDFTGSFLAASKNNHFKNCIYFSEKLNYSENIQVLRKISKRGRKISKRGKVYKYLSQKCRCMKYYNKHRQKFIRESNEKWVIIFGKNRHIICDSEEQALKKAKQIKTLVALIYKIN